MRVGRCADESGEFSHQGSKRPGITREIYRPVQPITRMAKSLGTRLHIVGALTGVSVSKQETLTIRAMTLDSGAEDLEDQENSGEGSRRAGGLCRLARSLTSHADAERPQG